MSPSIWQILIVVAIFAILFMGPSRIPGIGKSLGEAIRGFKKGLDTDEIDVTDSMKREQVAEGEGDKDKVKNKKAEKETT